MGFSEFEDKEFHTVYALEPGQMIIWEQTLSHLEEKLQAIRDRASYYNEYSHSKLDFLEMIDDLRARAQSIRKTNQGEG